MRTLAHFRFGEDVLDHPRADVDERGLEDVQVSSPNHLSVGFPLLCSRSSGVDVSDGA